MSLPPEINVEVFLAPGGTSGVDVLDQPLEVTVARVLPGPPGPQGPPGQSGATSFVELQDTPPALLGSGLHFVRVNVAGTQLEFLPPEQSRIALGAAPAAHGHEISDVSGLQLVLDGKAALVHAHVVSDVTGLQPALDGKAALVHTHAVSDVTGLQPALDGKAPVTHTHTINDVTGAIPPARLAQAGATVGQVLMWDGSSWVPTTLDFVLPQELRFVGVGLLWEDGVAMLWDETVLVAFDAPTAVMWPDGLFVAWEDQAVIAW